MEDFILQGGVDTSLIKWMKTDGIGRTCRNGQVFLIADHHIHILCNLLIDLLRLCKAADGAPHCRNGLNFTERGFGIRGAVGCSDRANTAISKATPEDF